MKCDFLSEQAEDLRALIRKTAMAELGPNAMVDFQDAEIIITVDGIQHCFKKQQPISPQRSKTFIPSKKNPFRSASDSERATERPAVRAETARRSKFPTGAMRTLQLVAVARHARFSAQELMLKTEAEAQLEFEWPGSVLKFSANGARIEHMGLVIEKRWDDLLEASR